MSARSYAAYLVFLSLNLLGVARADSELCAAAAGLQSVTVHSGGIDRTVAVYFPRSQHPGQLAPLIIDLHGSGSNGESHAATSGFRALADKRRIMVASPDGAVVLDSTTRAFAWNIPGVPLVTGAMPPAGTPDDVQFIDDLIRSLVSAHCADPRRVYATGMSGGARMTSLLGCRLSTRLAAIAPVAGLRAGLPSTQNPAMPDGESCKPDRAVPVLSFHGTGDPTNPFNGGGPRYWGYSVEQALVRWAELDGCASPVKRRQVSAFATRLRYGRCRDHAEVLLYVTDRPDREGGGHIWPGAPARAQDSFAGSVVGQSLQASDIILKFFRKHSLKSAPRSS